MELHLIKDDGEKLVLNIATLGLRNAQLPEGPGVELTTQELSGEIVITQYPGVVLAVSAPNIVALPKCSTGMQSPIQNVRVVNV